MARKKRRETARERLKPRPNESDEQWWERMKDELHLRKVPRPLSAEEEIRKELEAVESSPEEPLSPEEIDRIVKYAIDHANDE